MKIKHLTLLTLSLFAMSSCQTESVMIVDIPLSDTTINLPKLTIKELKLAPSPKLIAITTQVEKIGNKLYIFDAQPTKKSMFIFNDKGAFINDFAFIGRGRGEVIMPFSFFVTDDTLNIIDIGSYNLASYSLSGDNEFISSKKIPFSAMTAVATNDDEILWDIKIHPVNTENEFVDYCYLTTDRDSLTPKKGVLKQTVFTDQIRFSTKPAYKVGDAVHFTDRQRKSIYELDEGVEKEIYRIKYGNFEFAPIQFLNRIMSGEEAKNAMYKSEYIRYYFLYETEESILATFIANKKKYIAMYNKDSGDSFMLPMAKFNEKIGYKISRFINTTDDSFVAVVENDDANPTLLFIK